MLEEEYSFIPYMSDEFDENEDDDENKNKYAINEELR